MPGPVRDSATLAGSRAFGAVPGAAARGARRTTSRLRTLEVYRILSSLLALLCVASVVGFGLKRRYRASPQIENLNARIRSWWILVLVGGAALLAGPAFIIVLFAFLSFAALREFITDRLLLWLCYCVVPVQYVLVASPGYARYSPVIDL